jgi:apolipoprotein N-acyltransferase
VSAAHRGGLVLSSAGLYSLLLSTQGGALLSFVALVPLLLACATTTPARAFTLGGLFGLAATLGVAWWFPGMVERYFGVTAPLAWLALVAVGATLDALPYALFGAWLALAARRDRLTPLGVGAAWALAELSRVHAPIANPYALLAYAQHGTWLAQAADLAGPYGVGLLLAAANAALAAQLAPVLARGRPRRALALAAACVAVALAYGELRLGESFGDGQPLRVALVQGAIARGIGWDRSTRDANLARYLDLNAKAARGDAELVFWPEFAVDFYLSEETLERARLLDGVRAGGVDVVLGAARYDLAADGTRYFNSVYAIDRSGRLHAALYDKQRLVPFAEYAPLGDWLRARSATYVPGDSARVLDTRRVRVGAFVCAEALYPDVARELARAGAELLANPSNDYWFGAAQAEREQLESAAFRAIENRRYLVRATSTGVSAVVDPHGRVVARSAGAGPEIVSARLERSTAVTPYQQIGDAGVAGVCLVLAALGLVGRARDSRTSGGST